MKTPDTEEWTNTLLERITIGNPSLDFASKGVVTKKRTISGVFTVDKLRTRNDGLFDRLFLEYEFFKPTENLDVWRSELTEFGWLIRVQYALHRSSECPIPCVRDGGYCNLFDLTEFVPRDGFVDSIGSFPLGEENSRIEMKLAELGSFLVEAIPIFVEKKIRQRLE